MAETKNAATTLVRRPNGEVEELKEATVDFGWFVPSGDTMTTMRELGVAAVAMASPFACLGLHGEEEGKWNGGGGELVASWHT